MDRDFLNLRPLEIMACGGFLISDRIPCLEREFNGGAVFTDGGSDPVEKISTYLEDEEAHHPSRDGTGARAILYGIAQGPFMST